MLQLRELPIRRYFTGKPIRFQHLEAQNSDSGYHGSPWLREWLCFPNSAPERMQIFVCVAGVPSGSRVNAVILATLHSTLYLIRRPEPGPLFDTPTLPSAFSLDYWFQAGVRWFAKRHALPVCFTPRGGGGARKTNRYKVWLLSPRKGPVLLSCACLLRYSRVYFSFFLAW